MQGPGTEPKKLCVALLAITTVPWRLPAQDWDREMILVYLMWPGCFQPGDSEPTLQRQDKVVGSQSELVPSAYAAVSAAGQRLMVLSLQSNVPGWCGLIQARALD